MSGGAYGRCLFPPEIVCRIEDTGRLIVKDPPQFDIEIDMKIGNTYKFPVRVVSSKLACGGIRRAYRGSAESPEIASYGVHTVWSPPLMVAGAHTLDGMTENQFLEFVLKEFHETLIDPKRWQAWAMVYYWWEQENFQCDILIWLGECYRSAPERYKILETALFLLWLDYFLLHKFEVPTEHVPLLRSNVQKHSEEEPFIPHDDLDVIPEMVSRFCKSVVLKTTTPALEEVTTALRQALTKSDTTISTVDGDLATCLMMILMMFIGSTQAALLLRSEPSEDEVGIPFGKEGVERTIQEIEMNVLRDLVWHWRSSSVGNLQMAGNVSRSSTEPLSFVAHLREVIMKEYGKPNAFLRCRRLIPHRD